MKIITSKLSYLIFSSVDISDLISFGALFVSVITAIIAIVSNSNAYRSAIAAENSAQSGNIAAQAAENSAKASHEANIYSKKQTELLEQDLLITHSPKLIPLHGNIETNLFSMHEASNSAFSKTIDLNVTNVFQGNAYVVSAWLEISAENVTEFSGKVSNAFYKETMKETYTFNVINDKKLNQKYLEVNIYNSYELNTGFFQIPIETLQDLQASILKEHETIKVLIPPYIYPIFLHILLDNWNDTYKIKKEIDLPIKLYIKFKSASQLEQNLSSLRVYNLTISHINPILNRKRESKDDFNESINFCGFKFFINYIFLKEIKNDDHIQ